jgi:hypothetical protein
MTNHGDERNIDEHIVQEKAACGPVFKAKSENVDFYG